MSDESAANAMHESRESLWWLAAAPLIWLVHLLASYLTAAIFCAKSDGDASLGSVRVAIALYSTVALAALVGVALRGVRNKGRADALDVDSTRARHGFLGLAVLLLSLLAMLGVVLAALPAAFTDTCR